MCEHMYMYMFGTRWESWHPFAKKKQKRGKRSYTTIYFTHTRNIRFVPFRLFILRIYNNKYYISGLFKGLDRRRQDKVHAAWASLAYKNHTKGEDERWLTYHRPRIHAPWFLLLAYVFCIIHIWRLRCMWYQARLILGGVWGIRWIFIAFFLLFGTSIIILLALLFFLFLLLFLLLCVFFRSPLLLHLFLFLPLE